MERPERHLHREAEQRTDEEEQVGFARAQSEPGELRVHRRAERLRACQLSELEEVERAGCEEEREEREQQCDAADHRVNEELERRLGALRAAPELDEEERGDEAEFPEQEPVEEVQCGERAEESALEEEEEAAVERDVLADALRSEHGHRDDERGEHQHHQSEAVEGDVILDAERGNPDVPLGELHPAVGGVRVNPERGDEREREDVDGQREAARELPTLAVHAEDERGPHQRQEGQNRDEREAVHLLHPTARMKTKSTSARPMLRRYW